MVGEFGREDLPVRPELRHVPQPDGGVTLEYPRVCPQGHHLGPGRAWVGWSPIMRLPHITCRTCYEARDLEVAEWCLVDPYDQHTLDDADQMGLQLVAIPPPVPAGVGQIKVHVDGRSVADVDVMLCGECRVGVIEQVRVDEAHWRRGFAWTAVTAALVRGPGYSWSTTLVADTDAAREFWARRFPRIAAGQARYCPHMIESWQTTP
ncbi:hypothetical protein [Prauserella flavalba]|uniref:hypothetical protein n=1 Tax=Prauserella flavalba TaxID=1477506 RepID=UPI0036E23F94